MVCQEERGICSLANQNYNNPTQMKRLQGWNGKSHWDRMRRPFLYGSKPTNEEYCSRKPGPSNRCMYPHHEGNPHLHIWVLQGGRPFWQGQLQMEKTSEKQKVPRRMEPYHIQKHHSYDGEPPPYQFRQVMRSSPPVHRHLMGRKILCQWRAPLDRGGVHPVETYTRYACPD